MAKKILLIVLAFVLMVVMVSCEGTDSGSKQPVYKGKNKLPNLMAVSEDTYYILTSTYGSGKYRLSAGKNVEKLNFVYDVKDTSIWYLYAEGDYAAWVESYGDHYEYKVYDNGTDEVLSINTVKCSEDEQQNMQMGIYESVLYYSEIDYADEKIHIKGYNIKEKTTEIVHEAALTESISIALEVKAGVLTAYLGDGKLCSINLKNGQETSVSIPIKMSNVYAVSYDKENDLYALYYSAKGSNTEDIGTFALGNKQIKSIYTLSENCYAYRDNIAIDKGHLFWVTQVNASGNVVDHYKLVDYSCQEDTVVESSGAFGFALTDDILYTLSFVNNIDRVALKEIKR